MKKKIITSCLLLFTGWLVAQTYVGELLYLNQYHYMKVACANDSCLFSLPDLANERTLISAGSLEQGNWKVLLQLEEFEFDTRKTEDRIVGTVSVGGQLQKAHFWKQLPSIPSEKIPYYTGVYGLGEERIVVYERFNYLHLMSPYSQETNSLKPIAEGKFWSVNNEITTFSNLADFRFQQLELETRDGSIYTFERLPEIFTTELWIPIMEDTLFAKLYMPQSAEKVPACLILPGGGATGMDNYEYEARYFASYGMATLLFDKSGNGKSKGSGNFQIQSFEEKNEQYQHLFRILQGLPEVDADRVGIHGPSEGGRLALLMAIDLGDDVSFVNAVAAPIMSMREGQLYAMDHHHRNMGIQEEDNLKIQQIWVDYYLGIIDEKIDSSIIDRALEYLNVNSGLFLPRNYSFPASPLAEDLLNDRVVQEAHLLKAPIFLQYGENDQRVHPYKSIDNFKVEDPNKLHISIYKRGNHAFMTPEYKICPGYMDDKIKWLRTLNILK